MNIKKQRGFIDFSHPGITDLKESELLRVQKMQGTYEAALLMKFWNYNLGQALALLVYGGRDIL